MTQAALSALANPWDVPGRLQGVDCSGAQWRPLPWSKLRTAGISFASVKAMESSTSKDPMFDTHVAGALSEELDVGAYHFLHSDIDGYLQAEAFVRAFEKQAHNLFMRPSLDWEDTRRVKAVGPVVAYKNALAFLRRLQVLTHRNPLVYTGPGFIDLFRGLDLSELKEFDLWVAHYRWDPDTGHDYGLQLPRIPPPWVQAFAWQCGGNKAPRVRIVDEHTGAVLFECEVDLDRDVFFGDKNKWGIFCADLPVKEAGLQISDGHAANDPYYVDRGEARLRDSEPDTIPGTQQAVQRQSSGKHSAVIAPILGVDDTEPPKES